jgi:hypothetical protein
VGYAQALLKHRSKATVPLALVTLVALAAIGLTFRATMPPVPRHTGQGQPLTQALSEEESLARTLLGQRPYHKEEFSVPAPSIWVQVANREPLSNANSVYWQTDLCITKKGTVTLLTVEPRRLLLRYDTPTIPSGTACPNGTLFYLSPEQAASR